MLKTLGIGVIGSGRIGTLRARLAAKHPSVSFLAISDQDIEKAKSLAQTTNADFYSMSNDEIISHPDVTAVFVSTPENHHVDPIIKALRLGKPVMVEKPLAMNLEDADRVLKVLQETRFFCIFGAGGFGGDPNTI